MICTSESWILSISRIHKSRDFVSLKRLIISGSVCTVGSPEKREREKQGYDWVMRGGGRGGRGGGGRRGENGGEGGGVVDSEVKGRRRTNDSE